MNKKQSALVIIGSIILSLLCVIFLSGYISAKLSTSQYLQKFKIFKPQSPIVINRREEVRISDVVDIQEAIDKAKSRVSLIALNKDGVMTVVGNAINLTSDGYFLTSKTIFSDPKTVYNVILTNGRAAPIEQIIIDPASSVAIVKTRLTDVSVAEITGAKELAVGRKVVLIKSSTVPFSADALTSIITSPEQESFGVVFSSDTKTRTFGLQNPGSNLLPGHAIIDLDGKIIGLWDGNRVLPATVFQEAQANFFANKTQILRPSLGFQYKVITPAESSLLVVPKGVYVTAVTANGPSAIAGLAVGDTITKMGQTEINENVLFEELLEAVKPADPVTFKVLRAGKTIDITITAGTLK